MTWTLDDGTVVLSNFIMEDEECSQDRLDYWGQVGTIIPLNFSAHPRNTCTGSGIIISAPILGIPASSLEQHWHCRMLY